MISSAVPPLRSDVKAFRRGLLEIADCLQRPEAVPACGVARASWLLTDGAGPLYNRHAQRSLIEAVWWIADGFAQCRPHDWRSPVIMKIDPEHVAWTCRRCGAIATSTDPVVRPA